jgi:hypothetical protein
MPGATRVLDRRGDGTAENCYRGTDDKPLDLLAGDCA